MDDKTCELCNVVRPNDEPNTASVELLISSLNGTNVRLACPYCRKNYLLVNSIACIDAVRTCDGTGVSRYRGVFSAAKFNDAEAVSEFIALGKSLPVEFGNILRSRNVDESIKTLVRDAQQNGILVSRCCALRKQPTTT